MFDDSSTKYKTLPFCTSIPFKGAGDVFTPQVSEIVNELLSFGMQHAITTQTGRDFFEATASTGAAVTQI